jgi:hypothetical protein
VLADAGTFNGVTVGASTLSQDQARLVGWRLDQTTSEGFTFTWRLPPDYIDNTPLTIDIFYYGESTSTGDIIVGVGVCSDTMGNEYGNDVDTVYDSSTYSGFTINQKETISVEINKTTMVAGDPISIIIYRNAASGSDTYVADCNVVQASVKYQSDNVNGDSI